MNYNNNNTNKHIVLLVEIASGRDRIPKTDYVQDMGFPNLMGGN